VIILAAAEMSTPVRVASWAATALVAFAGVNTVAFVHGRRAGRRGPTPAPVHEIARHEVDPQEQAA
jgi:hypothetical protein